MPTFLMTLLAAFFLIHEAPEYRASTRLLIENDQPHILDIQSVSRPNDRQNFYATEYKIISSEENLLEVIDTLNLYQEEPTPRTLVGEKLASLKQMLSNTYAALWQRLVPATPKTPEKPVDVDAVARHQALKAFNEALSIQPLEGEKLVDITITGPDPQLVAQQANALATVYARKNLEKKSATSTNALSWLKDRIQDLKGKMHEADLALQSFQEQEKILALDSNDSSSTTLANLSHLHQSVNEARAKRIDVENRLKSIVELSRRNIEDIKAIPTFIDKNLIHSIMLLREKYLATRLEYTNKSKQMRPRHPTMLSLKGQEIQLENQIREEIQQAINALQAELRMHQLQERTFQEELQQQETKSFDFHRDMITYKALKRDAESYRNLYQQASERFRELQLSHATATNNVQIVRKATPPIQPVPSRKSMKLLLALLLGSCMGTGIAILRESFDRRFKDATEIEPLMQIPFLGLIPHDENAQKARFETVSIREPESHIAESYLTLRTRILSLAPPLRTLMVTSAVSAEGKSSTAANLGVVFAQLGQRVLLVDTDLRRPSLHRHFSVLNHLGFANLLADGGDWQALVHQTSQPNLSLITAGTNRYNAPGLLSQPVMQPLLDDFRQAFDLVIFDAPVVLSIPDVEIVAPHMDAIVMVHAPDKCEKASVLQTKHILERANANILGIVLNNIRSRQQIYYDQTYDTYYYRRLEPSQLNLEGSSHHFSGAKSVNGA